MLNNSDFQDTDKPDMNLPDAQVAINLQDTDKLSFDSPAVQALMELFRNKIKKEDENDKPRKAIALYLYGKMNTGLLNEYISGMRRGKPIKAIERKTLDKILSWTTGTRFANFAAFRQDFENRNTREEQPSPNAEFSPSKPYFRRYMLRGITLAIVAIVIGFVCFRILANQSTNKPLNYTLQIIPHDTQAPQNIKVSYDVSQIQAKEIWIQAGMPASPNFKRKIEDKKGSVTFFSMRPDFRPLYLIVDGKPHFTHQHLHITDTAWVCTVDRTHKATNTANIGDPFPKRDFVHQDFLGLTKPLATVDDGNYWQHFRYINPIFEKFVGTDFTLEAEVSNREDDGGVKCFNTFFYIFTQKERISVNFVQKGCEPYPYIRVGKDSLGANHNPINARLLECDFQTFRNVKIISKQNTIFVYFEGNLICDMPYSQNQLGKIKGLIIGFKGSGGRIRKAVLSNQSETMKLF